MVIVHDVLYSRAHFDLAAIRKVGETSRRSCRVVVLPDVHNLSAGIAYAREPYIRFVEPVPVALVVPHASAPMPMLPTPNSVNFPG